MTHADDRYQRGLKIRKEVLGDEYVERSLANANEFNQPLQDLIVEFCWGAIWTRDGLDRKTRSLLNVAMLTTLGRSDELKLHIDGALNNGCSAGEIREALLQAAVYSGVPAGLDGFRAAGDVLASRATTREA